MSHEPIGGLVGGAASLTAAAGRAARRTYGVFANADGWALYLVLFAGVITIIKKNATPDVWAYSMWFGIALGIAALMYEMSSVKRAVVAFWQGRMGGLVWALAIWTVAFGFSLNQWVGAASENQIDKSNIHKAAFNQSIDVRKAVGDLEKQIKIKTDSIDWAKALDAPDSYDARIAAAEKDADYEATRGGCRSKCIAKQQLAASLRADKANAVNRATSQEEIKVLQARLDEARDVAANTKVETSETRGDLVILTKYAGLSEETAGFLNGLYSIIAISFFLSYASAMKQIDICRESGPRRRSNTGLRLKCWFARVFLGRDPRNVHIQVDEQERLARALDERMSRMRDSLKITASAAA